MCADSWNCCPLVEVGKSLVSTGRAGGPVPSEPVLQKSGSTSVPQSLCQQLASEGSWQVVGLVLRPLALTTVARTEAELGRLGQKTRCQPTSRASGGLLNPRMVVRRCSDKMSEPLGTDGRNLALKSNSAFQTKQPVSSPTCAILLPFLAVVSPRWQWPSHQSGRVRSVPTYLPVA